MTEKVKQYISKITNAIRKGRCIFFLGSHASIGTNGKYPPSANRLTKLLGKDLNINHDQNLAKVALHYEMTFSRGDLYGELKSHIVNDEFEPTTIQKFIAKVAKRSFIKKSGIERTPMIVTTNYDQLMERALEAEKVPVRVYAQNLKEKVEHWGFKVDGEELVLYKFHGCITEPRSIVITEEDYITFLTNQQSDSSKYPKQFEPVFLFNELLFLGYSLEDWTFRVIYSSIFAQADRSEKKSSYSIQRNPSPEMVKHWDREKNIKILNCDQFEFIKELAEKLEIDL